ncbi:LysR family transcriptional regulator [Zoogloea sp.]|uniref:LysR family transcriptional regulator n=1 Tax=Zoogloea sp. TaxID=49181 RepID=UPI0035AF3C95
MNLRFVEAFIWAARLKSVTRGAEKLHLTQSAVSNRIAALEEELGILLVDRRERGFRLTNAGMRFMVYAERFLDLQRALCAELGKPEQLPLTLRIGCIETVLHSWLIPLMDGLKRSYPQMEFELTVEMTHVLNEQIRRGSLDLVFSALPVRAEGILGAALAPFELVFAAPRALAEAGPMAPELLLAHDLLTFQRGSQPHAALLELLRSRGLGDKRVHTVSSISALVRLVEAGFGLATLPRLAVEQLQARADIAVLPTSLELTPLPLFASYWRYPAAPQLERAINDAVAMVPPQGG